MPVTPKHTWQETDVGVQVHVLVTGVSRRKLDVFATSALIKVNAPPYLFSVDLAEDVDDTKSTATIDKSGVTFSLVKKTPGIWGRLSADGDLDCIAKRRDASIDAAHEKANAAKRAAIQKKKDDEKRLQDRQWALENSKRRLVEQRKKEEFDSEARDLTQWQASLHDPAENDSDTESEDDDVDGEQTGAVENLMPDHPDYHGRGWRSKKQEDDEDAQKQEGLAKQQAAGTATRAQTREKGIGGGADIWEDVDVEGADGGSSSDSGSEPDSSDEDQAPGRARTFKPMPPPRRKLEPVQISFTKLETDVLPARENREVEIRQYKKQQKEAVGLLDTLDIAERQPVFLKDKGDALYSQGNFKGAINAYSTAIQLDPEHLLSYSNRAACWLKLGDADRCLADCEVAVELLGPRAKRWEKGDAEPGELERFRKTMARVLSRKAAAHCQLDELSEALAAYEEAARYSPDDAALQLNMEEVRSAMEPADAATLRKRADARFKAGDPAGAAEAYGLLLSTGQLSPSERVSLLSNRAAARLMAGELEAAVQDCNEGLVVLLEGLGLDLSRKLHAWVADRLLQQQGEAEQLPPGWGAGEAKRSSLQRLLARRGAAYGHLRLYKESADDLSSAAAVCRSSGDDGPAVALEADAERVRGLIPPPAAARREPADCAEEGLERLD